MKLYVLSGLPGAGKTTRSLEIVESMGAIYLSRDELRVAFRVPIDEAHLTLVMAENARFLLETGYDVVVDSWNLTPWDEGLWYDVAARVDAIVQWIHLDTPVDVCVARDAQRPLSIGSDLVTSTAVEFKDRLAVLSGAQ